MKRGRWLIVFLKAPTPGRVKTRMMPTLSAEQAADLYRCLAHDTLETVSALARDSVRLTVAYAADPRWPDLSWLDAAPPMFCQRGRHLGERLTHAFARAFKQRARCVIGLGSDAPELRAEWIRVAFEQLERYDVVLGPTTDGGYQLIGMTQPHPGLFARMPWSTPNLLGRTLEEIRRRGLSVHCLKAIGDLDTPEDLQAYAASPRSRHRHTRTARCVRQLSRLIPSPVARNPRHHIPTGVPSISL